MFFDKFKNGQIFVFVRIMILKEKKLVFCKGKFCADVSILFEKNIDFFETAIFQKFQSLLRIGEGT